MSLNVKFEFSFDFLLFLKIVVATLQFKLWLEFVLTQFNWSSSTLRHSHTKYPLSYAKLKRHFLGVIKFVVGTFQALSGNRSNSSRSSFKQCHLQFKLRLLICASLLERGQILNRFWCYHVSCSWRESPPSFIRSSPTQCHLHRNIFCQIWILSFSTQWKFLTIFFFMSQVLAGNHLSWMMRRPWSRGDQT